MAFGGNLLDRDTSATLLYFSYTTLTTLGYGDIVPVNEFARVFTSVEAIGGQLFLAVFIARLIGLHLAHQSKRQNAPNE